MEKLVRDRMLEIIKKDGKKFASRTANEGEYWTALKAKLKEEVEEFLETNDEDELKIGLADIYEVLNAIYDFKKIKKEELAELREKKAKERGAFRARIILKI